MENLNHKKFNKSIILAVIIGILLFFLLITGILMYLKKSRISGLYEKYRYPNEEFYGKELYSEIDDNCSDYELEIGNEIVLKGYKVLKYSGTEHDSESEIGDVGALSRYFYFNTKNVASQRGSFQLITCKISGNYGHVWVAYTCERYDENGTLLNASDDVLTLWYIENQGDKWEVVKVLEAP